MQNSTRRRKGAYHADTQEDYLKIAVEARDKDNIFYGNYGGKKDDGIARNYPKQSEKKSLIDKSGDKPSLKAEVTDFDYVCADPVLGVKPNEGVELSIKSDPSSQSALEEDKKETVEKVINFMLIGAPKIGKHDLIDSCFPGEATVDSEPLMKKLDLVVRKRTDTNQTVIYKFWLKELPNDSYETLIKLYYKQSSVFIFVYDLTSRSSFDLLLPEIEIVYQELKNKSFTTFLIATHSDTETQREVSYEEGTKLKAKYNMDHFIETNTSIERDSQQLRKKIDAQLLV